MERAAEPVDTWLMAKLFAVAAAIHLTIWGSFTVGFANHDVVAIWPAAGISLWACLRFGWRALPAVYLGDLAFGFFHLDFGVHFILISAGNALAAWGAASIIIRMCPDVMSLRTPTSVAFFVFAAALLSVFSMMVGTLVVAERFALPPVIVEHIAWRWFFSDLTGAVMVAPSLMAWSSQPEGMACLRRMRRPAFLTLVALTALSMLSLTALPEVLGHYPVMLLTMPLIIWLALRESTLECTLLLFVIVTTSLAITLNNVGDVSEQAFLAVQAYGFVIACTALVLHTVERGRIEAMRELDGERQSLADRVAERTVELRQRVDAAEAETVKMEQLALTDELTGFLNRRGFQERMRQENKRAVRYGYPIAVMMLDLDHFKRINDTLGHAAGDKVLKTLAAVTADMLRDGIDQIGRIGGEEFAILMPHTSVDSAVRVAERLRQRILETDWQLAEAPGLQVTASLGVSYWDPDMFDLDNGLCLVDEALYEAKRRGRNRVVSSVQFASV
ncbi:MAG: sensor domain-containing diguanylate cyclase [Geminicoccaceae bacterium]|nr:sensor domain-containing diguanylate cyclase [Geminicoccaceae bacterium]